MEELVDSHALLCISGTQGAAIPCLRYIEVSLQALGQTFDKVGFLLVKDPVVTAMAERKQEVPGVIGSNIFRDMRDTLQKTIGPGFLHGLEDSFRGTE